MRMLLIHSEFLKYRPTKKALKYIKDVDKKEVEIENVLVAFTCAEGKDEKNLKEVVKKSIKEIKHQFEEVKAKNIVIYPYAHLSSDLASPYLADRILKEMENEAKKQKLPVHVSPFGWYKAFELKWIVHPLAESFKEVIAGKEIKEETIEEKAHRIPSKFVVLTPEGKEHDLNLKKIKDTKFLNKYPLLKSFIYSEEVKGQPSKKPPSVDFMRKLEIADYEPASDPGNMRFYPNGTLIKDLLEDWAYKIIVEEFGAMKIDTPLLYNWEEEDIREQALAFRERFYKCDTPNKTLLLRFAGDFGLFRMMKDATFSYRQLPLRIYEISPSFRYEQRGELMGLKRLRFFHMPDLHVFCENLEKSKDEYAKIFKRFTVLSNGIGVDYALAFRVVEKYYKDLKPMLADLLKHAKKAALIELLKEEKHYWICKSEHQTIDAVGGNDQLATVQLDVKDSERYGIKYVDENGKKKGCIIIHTSVGSLERWIYALLETAVKKGKNPILPLWLSPVQVRVIPVSDKYTKQAEELMKKIDKENIRVDFDERNKSVGKKVRDAEIDWIPYSIVVGEREIKSGSLPVRIRETGKVKKMKLNEFVKMVKKQIDDKPFRKLTLPKYLTKRPQFVAWT